MNRKEISKQLTELEELLVDAQRSASGITVRLSDGSSLDEQAWGLVQHVLLLEGIEEDLQDLRYAIEGGVA